MGNALYSPLEKSNWQAFPREAFSVLKERQIHSLDALMWKIAAEFVGLNSTNPASSWWLYRIKGRSACGSDFIKVK
jgi:hypothetical protein